MLADPCSSSIAPAQGALQKEQVPCRIYRFRTFISKMPRTLICMWKSRQPWLGARQVTGLSTACLTELTIQAPLQEGSPHLRLLKGQPKSHVSVPVLGLRLSLSSVSRVEL